MRSDWTLIAGAAASPTFSAGACSTELDSFRDLLLQLAHRHLGLVPAVGRDDASVRSRGSWVFWNMTAGKSSPLSADHYYFP